MKIVQKNAPPLTNSIQMLRKTSEGDGESKTTKPENALDSKIVASVCFGLSRRRLVQYVFVSSGSGESLWNVLLARSFKMVEQANELLCGVRHSNIVMLAFRQLLPEINGKGRFPFADIFCCI